MAKLTESYLRNMIKKTLNEMQETSLKQTIGKNFHDLKQFVDELGTLIDRSTSDKELAYDIDELSMTYLEDFELSPLVSVLIRHLEEKTKHLMPQQEESEDEDEFDMYESRKRTTTNKVALKRK